MIAKGARLKDRYLLERHLGRGGMAAVWLANDEVLERPVAIKILSDTIASDPEFLARFRREAQVAAALSHPNLIGVYDYAEGDERPYLVMEYVAGENLAERLAQKAEVDCLRLARELLGALAHIHAAGIVHRDVKPQNVLIAPDGSAKLIDFGIARPMDATALTLTGHLLGTARYIAPEVMRGEPATERADLYSCGVVLRGCVGDRPVGRLRALVERLASEDPQRRPASAKEAAAELGEARPAPDLPTESFEPTRRFESTETSEPTLRQRRPAPDALRPTASPPRRARGRGVAIAAIVAACGALAVAFLVATDGPDDRPGATTDSGAPVPNQADTGTADRDETEAIAAVPAPSGNDPALGSSLNQRGFELTQAGDYEGAIPVLEEAIRAFPPGTDDLNYAYALFNLGNALRLSGRPQEAIPVLERRLEIPNQTGTVRRELAAAETARAGAEAETTGGRR
jgi:eukaryotic-like serine/threonine-protein kinase